MIGDVRLADHLKCLLCGVVALGCGRPTATTARAPSAVSLRETIESELIPARILAGGGAHGRSLADARAELGNPPVVVAAWRPGGTIVDEAWGTQRDAIFQGASMSKPVACIGAYVLVDRGVLSLDEDVNGKLTRWKVPPTPGGKPLTLRHLCTQTSGLAQVSPDLSGGYLRGEPVPTIVQMLAGEPPSHLAPLRFEAAPGERQQWSGENWLVLQLLVEDATHRDFAAVMKDVVLDPLDMRDSSFAQPPGPALMPGHGPDGRPVEGGSHVHPELAAVGLTLSARDAARFLIELERISVGRSHLLSAALQHDVANAIRARQLGLSPEAPPGFIGDGTHAYGFFGIPTAAIDREEGIVVVAGCHEDQPGCVPLVFDLARTVVRATHLAWTWKPIAPRTLEIRPVNVSQFAGTWQYPATEHDGHAMPQTTCTATPNGTVLTWACEHLPPRTMYSLGDGRFASLVDAPDLAFSGDQVRLLDGNEVLRAGVRQPPN
jgi:CubicO group peptidase (beta-lactamase class C family)